MTTRRNALALAALGFLVPAWGSIPAFAQSSPKPVKIGILNDMSSVYSDYQGIGSVIAAQMAVEDLEAAKVVGKGAGLPVEVVFADHQNKPDIGAGIARRWFDQEGVDVIMDVPNSAVALGVAGIAREKNKVFVGSGAGTSVLTGAQCSPNTVHWTYDTWALGNSLGQAIVGEGGKKWFFLTADYAFGKDLEKSAADAVTAAGGQVVGAARHPIATADFSSFLLQAQASGADVVGFANAGDDLGTSLKQAAEFGLAKNQRLAALIFNITNIPGIGLKNVQELELVTGYYWDLNDDTRAFAKRFQERHPRKNMPNDMQAGIYAATIHYLKAVVRLKSAADGRAVVETMKALPTDDPIFGKGSIRADGRKLHPMFLFKTKTVEESKGPWDVFKLEATIPADKAWRPLHEGGCPLVKS